MPPAARVTDMHSCPKVDPGPTPHEGGPVAVGDRTVLIGNRPAARAGDDAGCATGMDRIREGEPTVLIGGQEAARLGDPTEHGGLVTAGCPTVLIGRVNGQTCMVVAAKTGAALVCEAGDG